MHVVNYMCVWYYKRSDIIKISPLYISRPAFFLYQRYVFSLKIPRHIYKLCSWFFFFWSITKLHCCDLLAWQHLTSSLRSFTVITICPSVLISCIIEAPVATIITTLRCEGILHLQQIFSNIATLNNHAKIKQGTLVKLLSCE